MKVQIQFVVKVGHNTQMGRTAWIDRKDNVLVFSTIYVDEDTAYDGLDESDLECIEKLAEMTNQYKVVQIIKDNVK